MTQNQKRQKSPIDGEKLNDVCFIVSPIGKEGSDGYNRFKEVLDYIIKPAIETSSMKLRIIRADDINRSGSFIKDILQHLFSSFIVIVDLTDQNPNVFYELGVRHSLSARTILIAQRLEDIPSDLREYRTIIYDTSAKGSHNFASKIHEFISDIQTEPDRPDNPVLDRLPNLSEQKNALLEEQISNLKTEISNILSKGESRKNVEKTTKNSVRVSTRVERIITLLHAERQILSGRFTRGTGESKVTYVLPEDQGNFHLYFLLSNNNSSINDYWYLSIDNYSKLNIDDELADIRVLMERCSEGQNVEIKFIIVTDEDLSERKEKILKTFNKIKTFIDSKSRKLFSLELWDNSGLLLKEKELGIKVSIED